VGRLGRLLGGRCTPFALNSARSAYTFRWPTQPKMLSLLFSRNSSSHACMLSETMRPACTLTDSDIGTF
jgi:hypothetical protein